MTPEQKRIKIAEACGWTHIRLAPEHQLHGIHPMRQESRTVPDYLNDLNAMHSAELTLGSKISDYRTLLEDVCYRTNQYPAEATASQRADAFLLTIGEKMSTPSP